MPAQADIASEYREENDQQPNENKHGYAFSKHMLHMIPFFGCCKSAFQRVFLSLNPRSGQKKPPRNPGADGSFVWHRPLRPSTRHGAYLAGGLAGGAQDF